MGSGTVCCVSEEEPSSSEGGEGMNGSSMSESNMMQKGGASGLWFELIYAQRPRKWLMSVGATVIGYLNPFSNPHKPFIDSGFLLIIKKPTL